MTEQSDAQLLRDYAQRGRETAFREIVLRYTDFVYSAALRQVESSDIARDVAQSVFTDLARKARPLAERMAEGGSLAGWLYRSTRFAALNQLRGERRRLAHERQAMEQLITNSEAAPDWERVRPVLDEAMADLSEEDREALLLRYFKNQDLRTVGLALGVSDDTAQKRVSRAVERLREFFSKRDVKMGASGLAVLISANAVQSAPIGLAATISTTACLAGTTITTTATATTIKTIAMTTLQKTLITAIIAVAVGTGIYEIRQKSKLPDKNQMQPETHAVQATQPSQESKEAMQQMGQTLVVARVFFLHGDNIVLTNMNQFKNLHLPPGAVSKDLAQNLSKFEIVSNPAPVKFSYPEVVLLRERTPRRTPDGKWARVYGMVDGQTVEQISEDGNFEAWEKQHLMPVQNSP